MAAALAPRDATRAADFALVEHLGYAWTNERVTFPLTPELEQQVRQQRALVGPEGHEVAYQRVQHADPNGPASICFSATLPAYGRSEYAFANRPSAAKSDLQIREQADRLVIENEFIGIAVRRKLSDGQGPLASIRLRGGTWTGGSTFTSESAVKEYAVDVTARGPVFVAVTARLIFADGGEWQIRFRVEQSEPAVLVDEFCDAPGGGRFSLTLGGPDFRPTHMLHRDSRAEVAEVRADPIGGYFLEPWLHWNNAAHGNWFGLFTPTTATGDGGSRTRDELLSIGVIRPSLWVDPQWSGRAKQVGPHISAAVRDGLMTLDMPVQGGRRAWLMGALSKQDSEAILASKTRRVAAPPQKLIIKHGDFPLDKVKDMVLDWQGDEANHPRLHVRHERLPQWKARLKSNPAELRRWVSDQPINKYLLDGPIRELLATDDVHLGRRMAEQAEEYLQTCVDWYVRQDYLHCPGTAPHMQTLIVSVLNLVDPVLSTDAFTSERRQRVLARLAFLGYVVTSSDYWSPERGYSGFANMTSVVALYRTGLGCMLPSHPRAKEWAMQGLDQLRRQLYEWSDEDGGWLEAPHYAMVSLDHMLAGFSMAANAGYDDYAFDPRLRKVFEWFAAISTPRDSRTGGFRHLPPIGNTYHGEPTGIWGVAAATWKDRDPDFAARMLWMHEQGGRFGNLGIGWNFPSTLGYRWLMSETGLVAKPAEFGSQWFRKTGVVLRNAMQSERETYLHLIAGSNHDHYDVDSGSVVLYGKGRVLCDDWGYIGRHPEQWHSMLTSPAAGGHVTFEVETFASGPALDYVSGRKGAWRRQIAFSKDANPEGPSFFVLRDTHDADASATWRLWLTAIPRPEAAVALPKEPPSPNAAKPKENLVDELLGDSKKSATTSATAKPAAAQAGVTVHERGATLVGGEDVDLDIFVYDAAKLGLKTESTTQRVSTGYRDGREGPLQNTQTALVATIPGRGVVTALLYPRLKSEPSPRVTWHADGLLAQVETSAGKDYVFVASDGSARVGDFFFRGSGGAAQVRSRQTTLSLGAAGETAFGTHELAVPGRSPLRVKTDQ